MRFHQLSMTAFGPYATTQTIAFDELNDAGIFLLSGPTGAGKTSILDAICFALYGVVPGVREVKTLRSHHAAEGVAPEVVLEATIGDVRYRVRRSPEWHRPKKRGDGTTRENACASLTVLEADGTERLVSSRIAEVGHELTMAIGMSSEQFMQVVMLPQGDFQRFLHATSDERQSVLEKLFHTQRFTRIERWMHDRSRQLGARAAQAEKQVAQLVATIANRAALTLPDVLATDTLGEVGATARGWADTVLATVRAEHTEAVLLERDAQRSLDEARQEEQRAEQLRAVLERHAQARRVLAHLDDTEAQAAIDLSRLERHDAALLVRPLLQPLAALQRSAANAARDRDRALVTLAGLPEPLQPTTHDPAGCSTALRELTVRLAELRAALPREAALQRAGTELQAAMGARDELRHELDELTLLAEQLPAQRDEMHALVSENDRLAHGLDVARQALALATDRHEAAVQLPALRSAHDELLAEHLAARERAADAREHHLDVVERRLAGMAAELAGELGDGTPCQVCGSCEHPAPAPQSADAVTEQDQQSAAAEADQLRVTVDRLSGRLDESARSLQAVQGRAAGLAVADAASDLARCRTAVAAAESAVAAAAGLNERAEKIEVELRMVSHRLVELREQIASRDTEIAALKTSFQDAAREVATAVGPGGGTIESAVGGLEDARARIEAAAVTLELHETAQDRVAEALALADAEAVRQGFGSAAEAEQALLERGVARALRDELTAREGRRRDASAALAEATGDPELDLDVGPDMDALRARVAAATAEWRRVNAIRGTLEESVLSLASLVDRLDGALTAWEPARDEHATAEAMTRLVRGMGADNQLQMRLSSYVLATRLDQVLEAANDRLSHMRDQRYTLRRCGRTRGGARAGLGLEVLDTWTGEARAPSTLSGGETFVVSLALALGLADVVSEESGGLRVDTLFIDEGFGMLDPQTLDDVMDRIDALRAGGRTVGVVSHVTELRGRIPTQVHVELGKSGSSVAVRTLVA